MSEWLYRAYTMCLCERKRKGGGGRGRREGSEMEKKITFFLVILAIIP